jgi:hypothetical protein
MHITLVSIIVAVAVAIVSGLILDRLRRRTDRKERRSADLELIDVAFVRDDDEFESLSLDIRVRNLGTTVCPIQAAQFMDIQIWQFPRPVRPSFRPISHTYDADLGGESAYATLSQGVLPGEMDRFAIRLGTSRPLPPGLGSYLYLFRLELVLNGGATLSLGRFLVDIRQPIRIHGTHGMAETMEWRQQLAARARTLMAIVDDDARVDPRAGRCSTTYPPRRVRVATSRRRIVDNAMLVDAVTTASKSRYIASAAWPAPRKMATASMPSLDEVESLTPPGSAGEHVMLSALRPEVRRNVVARRHADEWST